VQWRVVSVLRTGWKPLTTPELLHLLAVTTTLCSGTSKILVPRVMGVSLSFCVASRGKPLNRKTNPATDDTDAINEAIKSGDRCAADTDCHGTTKTPAVVYFPSGYVHDPLLFLITSLDPKLSISTSTYLISSSILVRYITSLAGDPTNMPIIKATSGFKADGLGLIECNQYQQSGSLEFGATNVFFRQIKNMEIDTRDVPGSIYGIHWPSSQATSLQNIVFRLSEKPEDHHTGIFMEEGSGGFLGDLTFYGGDEAAQFGNQQFTMRNLTFYNCNTAIRQIWSWGWTYKNINVYNAKCGINMTGPVIAGITLIDSSFHDTQVGIATGRVATLQQKDHPGAGSLVMDNVVFENVRRAVIGPGGDLVPGRTSLSVQKGFAYVRSCHCHFGKYSNINQGNLYSPTGPTVYQSSDEAYFPTTPSLMMGSKVYERSKVSYFHLTIYRSD
jgi:glucan 1,3-beta-glucosidase